MATVYLAHDLRHDRKVALKVLRPELSAVIGADRFLVEIKTTANLQHPHILALYDSGQVDGTVFYVMPFVEGESLRDRLEREKQLPVADAVGGLGLTSTGLPKMTRSLFSVAAMLAVGVTGVEGQSADLPSKRVIQPPEYKPTPSPLSPAILVGNTLYLSGATGGDPKTGQLVSGGFDAEMRQVMSNLQAVLKAADMDLTNVVAVVAYLADMADYNRFNEIYREYFKIEPLPTRSTVAVRELARGARIELTMTAVRSANGSRTSR